DDPRVIKADDNAQAVMRIAVTSGEMAVQDLTVLVEDMIVDRLSAVPGVADVSVYGDRDRIFRIDVDQAKLASRGLTVADIANAVGNAAFDAPTGSLTSHSQDLIVRASATITTPEAFEATILSGYTRLGDVASVSLGPDIGESSLRSNGQTGVGLGIVRQAGSNTLEISRGVRAAVEEIRQILPPEVEIA